MIIIDPLIRVAIIAVDLYIWIIIIGAIMSWLVAFNIINTTNQFVYMIIDFIYRITEPALRPICLLYTSPSPRDATLSRMPSSA